MGTPLTPLLGLLAPGELLALEEEPVLGVITTEADELTTCEAAMWIGAVWAMTMPHSVQRRADSTSKRKKKRKGREEEAKEEPEWVEDWSGNCEGLLRG